MSDELSMNPTNHALLMERVGGLQMPEEVPLKIRLSQEQMAELVAQNDAMIKRAHVHMDRELAEHQRKFADAYHVKQNVSAAPTPTVDVTETWHLDGKREVGLHTYTIRYDAEIERILSEAFAEVGLPDYFKSPSPALYYQTVSTRSDVMDVPAGTVRCCCFEADIELRGKCCLVHDLGANPGIDPLDVEYDGVRLGQLLARDKNMQREWANDHVFTPSQRAAISAHWSAQLRLKVAASKAADAERERSQVMMPLDAEDCEW